MQLTTSHEDRDMLKALESYLDFKSNVDPKKEIRKRAKNIAIKLIVAYKDKAPAVSKIDQKIDALGDSRVKIRPRFKNTGKSLRQQVKAEARARKNARMFTATGWFKSAEALGAKPKIGAKVQGPKRGKIKEQFTGNKSLVTMTNQQPAANIVDAKGNLIKQAIKDETKDIMDYVRDKQQQAASNNGL